MSTTVFMENTDLNEFLCPDDFLQPGVKLRRFYGKGHPSNALFHIRAIVDEDWVVFCQWVPRKQSWAYRVEYRYLFDLLYNDGHLKKVG